MKGLKERLTSKEGQIRQNHMGKRVDFSGRTVIGPDPTLRLGEIAIPVQMANILTFPEQVTPFNMERLTALVNGNRANFVLRNGGQTRINLKYAMFRKGTELLYGDLIIRDQNITLYEDDEGKLEIPDCKGIGTGMVKVVTGKERLCPGDRLVRNGALVTGIKFTTQKRFTLRLGDVVERHLRDGDYVLLNRQPTLHRGSMMAKQVRVRPYKTIRMNLAATKSFNADFDGDEMNIHAPQSYETVAELKMLSATQHNMISPQESKPNIAIVQDSLLGAFLMTKGNVKMTQGHFYNVSLSGTRHDGTALWTPKRIQVIRRVMRQFGKKTRAYTGRGLISLILPEDFYYEKMNKASVAEPVVRIYRGVLYEGTLDKAILGASHNSLIQVLHKEYGSEIAANFVDNIQFITNAWLMINSFSVGLEDCMITSPDKVSTIKDTLVQYYTKAQGIEESTQNPGIREVRVTATLSQAKDIGMRIAKDAMSEDNNFLDTVGSGSKGDFFNIAQVTGVLGQQNLLGQRVKPVMNHGRRTLAHYPFGEMDKEREYESRGFVRHSFIHGLNPREFFFHAMSGREGICDTAMSTAKSGYIQRKIVKVCEDIQVRYDGTVRDVTGKIYQLAYGETAWDPSQTVKVGEAQEACNVSRLVEQLNSEYEHVEQKAQRKTQRVKTVAAPKAVVKKKKVVKKKVKKKINVEAVRKQLEAVTV
jgi:DNA-directed RNA polymerase beta' subunit